MSIIAMWCSHARSHLSEHKLIHTHVYMQGSIFLSNQISVFELGTWRREYLCSLWLQPQLRPALLQALKFGHTIQGAFLSLFEVNELKDLIRGDWLSVNSTPPQVYLLCSHRGDCSSSERAVRFCFGEQDGDALMCVLILSTCLPDRLSFLPTFMHIYWEHCLWCLAALFNWITTQYTWEHPSAHLFANCESVTCRRWFVIADGQTFKQKHFITPERLQRSAGCQCVCHNKGRWPLKSWICCGVCVCVCFRTCVRVCAQGWWSVKWFWQWLWCSI